MRDDKVGVLAGDGLLEADDVLEQHLGFAKLVLSLQNGTLQPHETSFVLITDKLVSTMECYVCCPLLTSSA